VTLLVILTLSLRAANIPDHLDLPSYSGSATGKKNEMWCPLQTSSVAKGGKEVMSAFASAREPNTVDPSNDQVQQV